MSLQSHSSKLNGEKKLLFYMLINKMKQQITENEEKLFSGKNVQMSVVTLNVILSEFFFPRSIFIEKMHLFQLIVHTCTSKGRPAPYSVQW